MAFNAARRASFSSSGDKDAKELSSRGIGGGSVEAWAEKDSDQPQ